LARDRNPVLVTETHKPTDRLPALSGLAERLEPSLGEYVAGLWGPSLVFDMAWQVEHLSPGSRRFRGYRGYRGYRGPSWSWVSVDAKVAFWTKAEMSTSSIFARLREDLPDKFYADIRDLKSRDASELEEQDEEQEGVSRWPQSLWDGPDLVRAFCGCRPPRPINRTSTTTIRHENQNYPQSRPKLFL